MAAIGGCSYAALPRRIRTTLNFLEPTGMIPRKPKPQESVSSKKKSDEAAKKAAARAANRDAWKGGRKPGR
ncbi:MAG: hypothetical protein KF861_24325 [Planctomycetaceae bacterium]|nr:hypothetical protein [Planctomycetaceae bacterium]